LQAIAAPEISWKGYCESSHFWSMIIAGLGSCSGGLWWSRTIVSIPSSAACAISALFEIPQSTVMMSVPFFL